jgi:hypothetical protein
MVARLTDSLLSWLIITIGKRGNSIVNIWRRGILLSGTTLTLLSVMVTACSIIPTSINSLAVGKSAVEHTEVSFPANGLHSFSGMKKSEILAIRSQAVQEHQNLISGSYVPSEDVFGQIVDGRPWVGLEGVSFCEKGPNISRGQAWQSQQICNPFILVAADVYISSNRFDRVHFKNKEALGEGGCPSRCQPSQISINPDLSQGNVTYDVSQFIRNANSFYNPALTVHDLVFDLEACNARDFGYHYLYVDPAKSSVDSNGCNRTVQIGQYFHCDNNCGLNGGCNNISPDVLELANFRLIGLPARCHVVLWKEAPTSNVPTKPDFTFDIDFK